ncbi:transmembrane protein 45B-like [Anneissia japonica]|uniref:transmembrane protein 45B-like n=1 Tax=Anneissia japonica TaxID=1529436 RepID=UPI00142564D4|nr:transmembrane protein 45B-like [Anneissia japonica]XP_033122944.1 transmembrane protein 45B-like [Anneissia japonica]XP_033122945.1 transmembrane protein 45B-like [Anneissia japonica]
MGTFLGHVAPGSFFICFAIWWIIQLSYHENGAVHRKKSALMRLLSRLPIEAIVIIIFAIAGVIGEMSYPSPKWTLVGADGEFQYSVEWQHCTMYTYFGLYGMIMALSKTALPSVKRYEKIFGAIAFAVEGMIFYFHVHHRSELDVHLHIMLVIAIFGCFCGVLGEAWGSDEKFFKIMRITCTMLQGTWFWMIAIVLYNPPSGEPWSREDHKNVMFITVAFTWHLLMDMFFLTVVYCIVAFVLRFFSYERKYALVGQSNHNDISLALIKNDNHTDECFDSE